MTISNWRCGKFSIPLDKPCVMGIVNVTPDSFSDGGRWSTKDRAVEHSLQLQKEGADILDIGGESTRPGAKEVSLNEELDRVIPVIEELSHCGLPISVDTSKPQVMKEAVKAGASIVNDVFALQTPGAKEVVAQEDCGVCLMHMQGTPRSMQQNPKYDDLMKEVKSFLLSQTQQLEILGVESERICIDPGFGFGKTVSQNFELLNKAKEFVQLGYPVLYGMSRKSSLGKVTGIDVPSERMVASVVAHLIAVQNGVQIIRVHDVASTVQALKIWNSTQYYKELL